MRAIRNAIVNHTFVLIFLILSSLFLIHYIATGQAVYGDGIGYYAHLHSIYIDHDLDSTNEYMHIYTPENNNAHNPLSAPDIQIVAKTQKGKAQNFYGTGVAILLLPFYAAADFSANAASLLGISLARNGYGDIYQIFAGIGTICYVIAGLWMLAEIGKSHGIGENIGKLSAFAILFSSPLLYYGGFDVINSHFASFFLACAFLSVAYSKEKGIPRIIVLGAVGGLMISTRPQDILLILIFAALNMIQYVKKTKIKNMLLASLAYISGFSLGVFPQAIQWMQTYDSPLSHPYIAGFLAERSNNAPIDLLGSLFHPQVGLFSATPLLLIVFLFYLYFIIKGKRIVFLPLFVFFLAQMLVITLQRGWLAQAFGGRMYISTLPFFFLALCMVIEWIRKHVSMKLIIGGFLVFALLNVMSMAKFVLFAKQTEGTSSGMESRTKERIERIYSSIVK